MTHLREMRRTANGRAHDYVVTLRPGGVEIRPKRTRRPDAAVSATWDQIYQRALLARPTKRKRTVKRGLLTLGGL